MPAATITDQDGRFDTIVYGQFAPNGAASPTAASFVGPPGMSVTRTGVGLYQINLPNGYAQYIGCLFSINKALNNDVALLLSPYGVQDVTTAKVVTFASYVLAGTLTELPAAATGLTVSFILMMKSTTVVTF